MTYRNQLLVGLGIVLAFFSGKLYAQLAGSIRGLTTDKAFNDEPLGGVRVVIVQTEQAAVSDDLGVFVIPDVAPGVYTLIFSKDGFTRQTQVDVRVSAGQLTEVSQSMPTEFTELPPFVVQELKLGGDTELGILELRQETPAFLAAISSEQLSVAGVSDASQAMSLISGATVNNDKPAIRGLPDRYVNSQVNGVRFPSADAETRSLELDQFPSDVIEIIQVSKTFTPDQQGDASGGAVNIILKGIPEKDAVKFGVGTKYNTNGTFRDDFRTYRGDGGVNFFGVDTGRQELPPTDPRPIALGTEETDSPYNYNTNFTIAKRYEVPDSGWTIGGVVNMFYDHGGSFYDDGLEAEYVVDFITDNGNPTPIILPDVGGFIALQQVENRDSNVFDITKSTEEVQWGTLAAFGAENEFNKIDLIYLETRTTKDTTIVALDTNSRGIVEGAIDRLQTTLSPADFAALGATDGDTGGSDLAYVRNQTLQYQERTIRSYQVRGSHKLGMVKDINLTESGSLRLRAPEIDWTWAKSESELLEPDQRVFRTFYNPDSGDTGPVFATNFSSSANTGYAQRSWENIAEDSIQFQLNFKLPFVLPNNEEGYFKAGMFYDRVTREFARETYTTDQFTQAAPFQFKPAGVPFEDFYLTDNLTNAQATVNFADNSNDVDFRGDYDIDAFYWMLDLPITGTLKLVGGMRFERTRVGIGLTNIDEQAQAINLDLNSADPLVTAGNRNINPDTGLPRGDVDFKQNDILPSLTLIYEPTEKLAFRAAYSQTIARATFRELTVIRQQEFLGSTQFFGNEELQFSSINNYDFRADYRPTKGGLISASVFYKEIQDPIEYISVTGNNVFAGSVTYPVNFPEGTILGGELELRQEIGELIPELTGLSMGANATIIESEVVVGPGQETVPLNQTKREMLNAPDMLLNLFTVYRNKESGTEIGLFYTVRGDTLVRGATPAVTATSRFTPNLYETQYDTLNFTFSQKLTEHLKFKFSAKNLTDPDIQTVYRGNGIPEVVQGSYSKGIDLSVSLSASFEF